MIDDGNDTPRFTLWDGSDHDLERARAQSRIIEESCCPAGLITYLTSSSTGDSCRTLYDARIRGVEFSTAPVALRRANKALRGNVTFRFAGPCHDRQMAIRFVDVTDYEAPHADHLSIGDIYWLEFQRHYGENGRYSCTIHTLARRLRYQITFGEVLFNVTELEHPSDEDFPSPVRWESR